MNLKAKDFVLVKDGIDLGNVERTSNWGGQIKEVYAGVGTCLIALDSIDDGQP